MIFTGLDGDKSYSVSYSILRKVWKPTDRKGKKIYVIPSHLCLVKKEEAEFTKLSELKKYFSLEAEEYEAELWDFSSRDGLYFLVLIKGFFRPEDAYALDCELFSLARLSKVLEEPNLSILDIGKHKTTFVRVRNYSLDSYRVVLRGGDYITEKLSQKENLSFEEAERLKKREGLENKTIKEALEEIIADIGTNLMEEKILLSGGGGKLKGLSEYFPNSFFNPYVEPELNSAFGASLKFIYKDNSPSFTREELSPTEKKILVGIVGLATLLFTVTSLSQDFLKREIFREFSEKKKELFSAKFPELPPVMVDEQLKSMANMKNDGVLKLLEKAFSRLPDGVKVYRINFKGGTVKIRGEATEDLIDRIKADTVRKTPQGTYEFEIIVR